MGAVLGCCSGPSSDYDLDFVKTSTRSRYQPLMMGRWDGPVNNDTDKSLLKTLQRSLSASWSTRRALALESIAHSPHGASAHAGGSRYGLADRYESDSDDTEPSGGGSNASVTSGSRLLCDFYNLVLECGEDQTKFFVDANGRRVKGGAYLNEIAIVDDYFGTTRRRRRSSLELHPLRHKKLQLHSSGGSGSSSSRLGSYSYLYDRSSTVASESDYWATFMDTTDATTASEYASNSALELTFPPPLSSAHTAATVTPLRVRRDSVERRRSWALQDLQLFGNCASGATGTATSTSSLLLFSPVHTAGGATPMAPKTPKTPNKMDTVRSRSSPSSSSSRVASSSKDNQPAVPMEGTRYNLWGARDDETTAKCSAAPLASAYSGAAVMERRRASLTMTHGAPGANKSSTTTSRRSSLHTIAPVAV